MRQTTTPRRDAEDATPEANVEEIHADRDHDMAERGENTAECGPVFDYGCEAAGDAERNTTTAVAEEPGASYNATSNDHFTNDKDHEELFYNIENPGEEDLIVIPTAGGKPCSSLPSSLPFWMTGVLCW